MIEQEFTASAEGRLGGGIAIKLPFDPSAVWGERERYDVTGTINGQRVRGKLASRAGGHVLQLGPAWCRDGTIADGVQVVVVLAPEGPQFDTMAEDIATALGAEPTARRFFESLPTFYRKNFMRWIEGAKRPETRAKRIAETVATLKSGKRER
ncbi:MAG: YdeI/OmpD-associated family protein [Chloroflexi bacterium]|nr:YdeI/OmpD-associated family protein [Chloroflexota bacterium]